MASVDPSKDAIHAMNGLLQNTIKFHTQLAGQLKSDPKNLSLKEDIRKSEEKIRLISLELRDLVNQLRAKTQSNDNKTGNYASRVPYGNGGNHEISANFACISGKSNRVETISNDNSNERDETGSNDESDSTSESSSSMAAKETRVTVPHHSCHLPSSRKRSEAAAFSSARQVELDKTAYLRQLGLLDRASLALYQTKKSERKRRSTANPQFSTAAMEIKAAAKRARRRENRQNSHNSMDVKGFGVTSNKSLSTQFVNLNGRSTFSQNGMSTPKKSKSGSHESNKIGNSPSASKKTPSKDAGKKSSPMKSSIDLKPPSNETKEAKMIRLFSLRDKLIDERDNLFRKKSRFENKIDSAKQDQQKLSIKYNSIHTNSTALSNLMKQLKQYREPIAKDKENHLGSPLGSPTSSRHAGLVSPTSFSASGLQVTQTGKLQSNIVTSSGPIIIPFFADMFKPKNDGGISIPMRSMGGMLPSSNPSAISMSGASHLISVNPHISTVSIPITVNANGMASVVTSSANSNTSSISITPTLHVTNPSSLLGRHIPLDGKFLMSHIPAPVTVNNGQFTGLQGMANIGIPLDMKKGLVMVDPTTHHILSPHLGIPAMSVAQPALIPKAEIAENTGGQSSLSNLIETAKIELGTK